MNDLPKSVTLELSPELSSGLVALFTAYEQDRVRIEKKIEDHQKAQMEWAKHFEGLDRQAECKKVGELLEAGVTPPTDLTVSPMPKLTLSEFALRSFQDGLGRRLAYLGQRMVGGVGPGTLGGGAFHVMRQVEHDWEFSALPRYQDPRQRQHIMPLGHAGPGTHSDCPVCGR